MLFRSVTTVIIALPFIALSARSNYALYLAKAEFQRLARTDLQTGLLNRRGFFEEVEKMIRGGAETTLLIIDIDHFKRVNDRFGHLVGDAVIAAVGDALSGPTAGYVCGRVGGEEFAVLLPSASPADAMQQADELRWHIVNNVDIRALGSAPVTVSIGLSPLAGQTLLQAYGMADKALYRAKKAGRNCCVIARSVSDPKYPQERFATFEQTTRIAS